MRSANILFISSLLCFVTCSFSLNCNIGVDCTYGLSSCGGSNWCITQEPHGSTHIGLNCDILPPNSICDRIGLHNGQCGYDGFIRYCCCNTDGCNRDSRCYSTTRSTTTDRTTTTGLCRNDWNSYEGTCYKVFREPLSWLAAEENCVKYGGHLASIHSAFENAFIVSLAQHALQFGDPPQIWLGLGTLIDGQNFRWSDSTINSYFNWAFGQPDTSSAACATLAAASFGNIGSGQWATKNCYQYTAVAHVCKIVR